MVELEQPRGGFRSRTRLLRVGTVGHRTEFLRLSAFLLCVSPRLTAEEDLHEARTPRSTSRARKEQTPLAVLRRSSGYRGRTASCVSSVSFERSRVRPVRRSASCAREFVVPQFQCFEFGVPGVPAEVHAVQRSPSRSSWSVPGTGRDIGGGGEVRGPACPWRGNRRALVHRREEPARPVVRARPRGGPPGSDSTTYAGSSLPLGAEAVESPTTPTPGGPRKDLARMNHPQPPLRDPRSPLSSSEPA